MPPTETVVRTPPSIAPPVSVIVPAVAVSVTSPAVATMSSVMVSAPPLVIAMSSVVVATPLKAETPPMLSAPASETKTPPRPPSASRLVMVVSSLSPATPTPAPLMSRAPSATMLFAPTLPSRIASEASMRTVPAAALVLTRPRVRLPPVETSVMSPLAVEPPIAASSDSVMNTLPVPVPVKATAVAAVRIGRADEPMSPAAPPAVSVTVLPLTVEAAPVRRMSPALAVTFTLPVVEMLPLIVQLPVVVMRSMSPEPVEPCTFAPFVSVTCTSPVPAPARTSAAAVVRKRVPLDPMSPSAPPAVSVMVLPLTIAPAPLRMRSPALAASATLPVVEMPVPITVQSPAVLVSAICPLPVVPLTLALFDSVMNTSPAPVPVNAIVVAAVWIAAPLAPMSPSAPPAVSVTRLPLTVPALRRMSPVLAVIVTLPVVEMLPSAVQLPVVLTRLIVPLPVVPFTFAPLLSVMNTSPVPAPANAIEVPVV